MGSLSKSHIHDCGKRDPKLPRTVIVNGERRSERYPSGVTQRFVSLQGNVVTCQLVQAGVPGSPDAIGRARIQLQRAKNADGSVQGFVEHDVCPLRHGAHLRSPLMEEEFAAMPEDLKRPCKEDPETRRVVKRGVNKHIEYLEPCAHIQWLIQSRRVREQARRDARSARQVSVMEIEQQKLELARQQVEETRKANERMVAAVENATGGKAKKAPTE
jgi:hypothetical protein